MSKAVSSGFMYECRIAPGPDEGTFIATRVGTGEYRIAWTQQEVLSLATAAGWKRSKRSYLFGRDSAIKSAFQYLRSKSRFAVRPEWCRGMI